MYLKNIIIENVGPIDRLDIELEFTEQNDPMPLILVGENGTGKTIVLSHIVDALIEYAKQAYNDIVSASISLKDPYFKVTGGTNIKVNTIYGFAFLHFIDHSKLDQQWQYLDKSGSLENITCGQKTNGKLILNLNNDTNQKLTSKDKAYFEPEFSNNSYIYFPTYRYEYPHWFNKNSQADEHIIETNKLARILEKPIIIYKSLRENKIWLLDVILDTRADLISTPTPNGIEWSFNDPNGLLEALLLSKKNIEMVFSEILCKQIELNINLRNSSYSRISIIDASTKENIIPSLDHLSTGQSILLNMFLTIIRYSDKADIKKSIALHSIQGIVIIDEIEQHLHAILQREVLPKLIKLFPKVQFIITSHAPLFLLGMEDAFGKNGFSLYEMPHGTPITTERFSEFQKSYNYYKTSKQFEIDLQEEVAKIAVSPKNFILYTEGETDVIHLKNAWQKLYGATEMPFDIFSLDSESKLRQFLVSYSIQQIDKTVIGLFDADEAGLKAISQIEAKDDFGSNIFKLRQRNAYATHLPFPNENFEKGKNCPIEFMYSKNILDQYGMIIKMNFQEYSHKFKPESAAKAAIHDEIDELFLYKLKESGLSKKAFAEKIVADTILTSEDFQNFDILFKNILTIVNQ